MITRLAPSPTGAFHLGTARTGYINYLQAKATNGKFILRIDDTDVERNKPEWTQLILDTMDWLGLEPNEVHYQSGRTPFYLETSQRLLDAGKAFVATNGAIILRGPTELPQSFYDTIAGEIAITDTNLEQITDRIVLMRGDNNKTDNIEGGKPRNLGTLGQPTYQFASVVDDYYMGVSHIIRGVDHITNTSKQIAIWNALNNSLKAAIVHKIKPPEYLYRETPLWTHLGLIFKDKKKLSKRDGAASLLWYKEQGYKPEAILNWMLLLGWSLKVPRDASNKKELEKLANGVITKDMAIELFNQGSLKNSPCSYSLEKLESLNKKYVRF